MSETLEQHRDKSRSAIGRIVCDEFGFYDARGERQWASCMKALGTLEAEQRIVLPAAQPSLQRRGPRLLEEPVAAPVDVPDKVREIRGLAVKLVTTAEERAIWNTLMAREHPQGTTTFAGAQLRYLFTSAHGTLGAIGFSAAALYLRPRDAWIAWSPELRENMRKCVVNLSRFLIRPQVQCKHLASHLLGRVLRRLRADWQARYAYAPWLVETFVGPDQEGTCFKAANFLLLGLTQGRGRHAPTAACTRSRKKVFVFELVQNWRKRLGVPHVELYPRLEPGVGLDSAQWAQQEFGDAPLGDKRRSTRLVKIAQLVGETMGHPITAAPRRDPAAIRATYRFLDKANHHGITPKEVLDPHRQHTVQRMRTQSTVLCVQDTTKISYSTCPKTQGLEIIGQNQTSSKSKGIALHATLALGEDGLPLGVLRCAYKMRKGAHAPGTLRWIDGLHDIEAAAQTLPRKTRVISVMDREADVFAVFAAQRPLKRTHLLVRAKVNRRLDRRKVRLFKAMRRGPAMGVMDMTIEKLSRREKAGRVTHEGREPRLARMEVRFRMVTLSPPKNKPGEPLKVWAIHIREINPPDGEERIEWYLLTTLPVNSLKEALQVIEFYALRWRVEDIFKVLKSGCKVENLRLRQAASLHNLITIYMVTAWRIMLMTLLGRAVSDLPPEVIFTDDEMAMLELYARNYKLLKPVDLPSAIKLVALMGGYMDRKHDPPPGYTVMWRGYARLQLRAIAYQEIDRFYDLVERSPPGTPKLPGFVCTAAAACSPRHAAATGSIPVDRPEEKACCFLSCAARYAAQQARKPSCSSRQYRNRWSGRGSREWRSSKWNTGNRHCQDYEVTKR